MSQGKAEKHKRRKVATRASLASRVRDLEAALFGLLEHVDRLQDQQLVQHVELTALKQLLAEGRPITPEAFNKRCDVIYQEIVNQSQSDSEGKAETDDASIPEGGPAGSETGTETVVDAAHSVATGA